MFQSFTRNHSVRVLVFTLAFAILASWATSRTLANRFNRNAALPTSTADLAISKTASPSAGVANGSQMTYTITVSNSGPDTATDATVNDPLPASTTFVSVAPSQGACSAPAPGNNGTVNCSLGAITAPASATITLVVTFAGAPGSSISNTATVATTSVDMNSANNAATSNTMVAQTTCAPVTNNSDSLPGSLRAAIICANNNPGLDAITFNILGSGVHTIALLSPLPSINGPVFLDGYTQPGASKNTLSTGDNAVLTIELNGASAGFAAGLNIGAGGSGSTIRGLVINGFNNQAVNVNSGVSGLTIEGNFIGTNASGTAALPNGVSGNAAIFVGGPNTTNNTIGGVLPASRNVISGNRGNAISIANGSTGTVVQGNFIGTNSSGMAGLANGLNRNSAVFIGATGVPPGNPPNPVSNNNTIGGTAAGAGNVISGNFATGVQISSGSAGNMVQGNLIGTNVNGTSAVPNGQNANPPNNPNGGSAAVFISGINNTIGGALPAARNIISGNGGIGLRINGDTSTGNTVQGNYIGTDITGNVALGNARRGVAIFSGASNNTVAGNVLSGNDGAGLSIENNANSNQVQGNLIGTNANGTTALGNAQFGVLIDRSSGNTIATNTIAFNGVGRGGAGVLVGTFDPGSNTHGLSAGNVISQNSIFSNYGLGIDLSDDASFAVTPNDSCDSDSGPNNFQNFPILNSVSSSGGNTTIQGTLNSAPNTSFTIEFFANAAADPSGNGEGQTYIGSTTVITGPDCNATYVVAFADTPGQPVITATATDPAGNTSEFSAWSSSTTTTLSSNSNPSNYGQPVTFTATVSSGAGTPSGTVTFKDGSTTLGTGTLDGSGQATFTTSTSLSVGTHNITAVYNGSTNYNSSTSAALIQTVNQATTTTTLASNNNPSAYGQSVTFTATVTSSAGTPTGTVTFKDGTTTLGTSSVDGSGHATLTTSSLSAGTHSITAVYNGDGNFSSSTSSATTQVVNQAGTTTSLTSSQNPSIYGQSVTFTATVTSSAGTPTGTVTFKDGTTTLGTSSLDGSGHATLTTSSLYAGTHSITAVYNGDSNFSSSTSSATTQIVNQASTTTSLTSSPNPSAYGQPVTFTATVTAIAPGGGVPTGTITFKDGTTVLGTGTLNSSGQATFTTSSLAIEPHSITATYNGDANFSGSNSTPVVQIIFAYPVGTGGGDFVIGDLNATVGQQVTFWGAKWAKLNSLSGGSAPSSFKGFANSTSTNPPTCGGAWDSDPGNSSGPPSSVPEFIAVIVSSSITKSGSTISGNTRMIAIVRTDPGYASNPGHAGTGTVVAVICQ